MENNKKEIMEKMLEEPEFLDQVLYLRKEYDKSRSKMINLKKQGPMTMDKKIDYNDK